MDEEATEALFVAMLRAGLLSDDIILDAAEQCDAAGHDMSAHRLRCLIVSAASEPVDRRPRLRIVPDGGNAP